MRVSDEFKGNIIKEYDFWTLLLHTHQLPHLGRCYIWWRDRGKHDIGEGLALWEIHPKPLLEGLQKIPRDILKACKALGHNTEAYGTEFLLNTTYLANEMFHHKAQLHVHFIPRYKQPLRVEGLGITCVEDRHWGKHYAPMSEQAPLPAHDLSTIRLAMAAAIG